MIKAVFVDIDGTLVNDNRELTEKTINTIKECEKNDIKIILASGRSRLQTLERRDAIGSSPYIISSNGADVYDIEKNREIYIENIPQNILNKFFKYATDNNYKMAFNYEFSLAMNMAYYEDEKPNVRSKEFLKDVIKNKKVVQFIMSNRDINKMFEFKKYLINENLNIKIENESKRLIDISLKPARHYYCDLVSKNVSKGKAVQKVCEYLELKSDEIATIGDGINDVPMFKLTPNSYAMGNASNEVKKEAKFVADTNNNDGLAKVLKDILFQNSSL